MRLRDIAQEVGITERATQKVVNDLVAAGYVSRRRIGRRNHYRVHADLPLHHPLARGHPVEALLTVLTTTPEPLTYQRGGTQGSPTDPLLDCSRVSRAAAQPSEARLGRTTERTGVCLEAGKRVTTSRVSATRKG